MDNQRMFETSAPENPSASGISTETIIIIILSTILLLSFLGTNVLILFGEALDKLKIILNPAINEISDSTGKLLNTTSNVATSVGKTSLDITNSAIHDIGDLLQDKNAGKNQRQINNYKEVTPSPSESPIQKNISSGKSGWCLVGEYQEKRGCIAVSDQDKCLSGQIFPDQATCLQPNIHALQTPNIPVTMQTQQPPILPPQIQTREIKHRE